MRVFESMRRLREGFYRGPDWIDAPDVSVGGYKSPTVMLACGASRCC
jgi:hypothetical protein